MPNQKELLPVNPIPDRKAELSGDQLDIEEYIMSKEQRFHGQEELPVVDQEEEEMTPEQADEIEEGLQRDEAAELILNEDDED